MQAQLESLSNARDDVKICKIKLPRSASAVGAQYQIRSVPHLVLYEGSEEVATGTRSVMNRLNGL